MMPSDSTMDYANRMLGAEAVKRLIEDYKKQGFRDIDIPFALMQAIGRMEAPSPMSGASQASETQAAQPAEAPAPPPAPPPPPAAAPAPPKK